MRGSRYQARIHSVSLFRVHPGKLDISRLQNPYIEERTERVSTRTWHERNVTFIRDENDGRSLSDAALSISSIAVLIRFSPLGLKSSIRPRKNPKGYNTRGEEGKTVTLALALVIPVSADKTEAPILINCKLEVRWRRREITELCAPSRCDGLKHYTPGLEHNVGG